MEILSGKVNFTDRTFIDEISKILKDNKNSKESINLVSKICKNKFKSLNLTNYRFTENKILKEKKYWTHQVIIQKNNRVSVVTCNYGDYFYTFSVW